MQIRIFKLKSSNHHSSINNSPQSPKQTSPQIKTAAGELPLPIKTAAGEPLLHSKPPQANPNSIQKRQRRPPLHSKPPQANFPFPQNRRRRTPTPFKSAKGAPPLHSKPPQANLFFPQNRRRRTTKPQPESNQMGCVYEVNASHPPNSKRSRRPAPPPTIFAGLGSFWQGMRLLKKRSLLV
jgi:hypothetical protein